MGKWYLVIMSPFEDTLARFPLPAYAAAAGSESVAEIAEQSLGKSIKIIRTGNAGLFLDARLADLANPRKHRERRLAARSCQLEPQGPYFTRLR